MTLQEAKQKLELHQEWRLGYDEIDMLAPSEITTAINVILEYLDNIGQPKVMAELTQQNDVREDDVEKLVTEWLLTKMTHLQYYIRNDLLKIFEQAKQMELKAKETLYTEEQVREVLYLKDNFDMTENEIIQSLKQSK